VLVGELTILAAQAQKEINVVHSTYTFQFKQLSILSFSHGFQGLKKCSMSQIF